MTAGQGVLRLASNCVPLTMHARDEVLLVWRLPSGALVELMRGLRKAGKLDV